MIRKIGFAVATFLIAQSSHAGSVESAKPTFLICKGKVSVPTIQAAQIDTEALVKLGPNDVYIEVSLLGSGAAQGKPRFKTGSMVGTGSLTIKPALEGQSPIEAFYNLNRYTGELILLDTRTNKVVYMATCKQANPLF